MAYAFQLQNTAKSDNDIPKMLYLELIEYIKATDIVLDSTEPANYIEPISEHFG